MDDLKKDRVTSSTAKLFGLQNQFIYIDGIAHKKKLIVMEFDDFLKRCGRVIATFRK